MASAGRRQLGPTVCLVLGRFASGLAWSMVGKRARMRFRFAFAIATLCTGIVAACASGDLESQDGGIGGDLNPDVDGSVDAATDGTGVSSIDAAGPHDSS